MKTKYTNNNTAASTYALLVRSEEKERSLSETCVYLLLLGSTAVAMWYTAVQPIRVPVVSVNDGAAVAQTVTHAKPARA